MRTTLRLGLLAVVLSTSTGCGATAPAPPAPPAPTAAPSSPLPPRPREARIDGVDPCQLITPAVRARFGLTDNFDRRPTTDGLQTSDCQTSNFDGAVLRPPPRVDVRLRLIRDQAAAVTLQQSPTASRVITVAGFGAVESPPQIGPKDNACTIDVDVANGQMMSVFFGNGGNDLPNLSYQLMCSDAHVVAEAAMRQLLAQVH